LPGHYVAGSAWRPRHIHLRAQAPGHRTLVTQLYFNGDPLAGEADTACSSCKSDHELLTVQLHHAACNECTPVSYSLAELGASSTVGVTLATTTTNDEKTAVGDAVGLGACMVLAFRWVFCSSPCYRIPRLLSDC
jgi:protocatechuate 3,4-dioxygenase beta subunit